MYISIHTVMDTTILQLVAIYNTTACFDPVCRPSSGCPKNLLTDDDLHTRPKHVVVYYILLLIVILLCSLLYAYIDIYTLQLCIIDLTQRGWHTLRYCIKSSRLTSFPAALSSCGCQKCSVLYCTKRSVSAAVSLWLFNIWSDKRVTSQR